LVNILHISNNDFDGAGRAAARLNKSLNSKNVNSRLLVIFKKTRGKKIYSISSGKSLSEILILMKKNFFFISINYYGDFFRLLIFKFFMVIYNSYYRPSTLYNFPIYVFNFTKILPYLRDSDVIVLHSIQNVLSIENILEISQKLNKKIVFHPLDMEMVTGGYHFSYNCKCYQTGRCSSTKHNLNVLSKNYFERKVKILKKIPITWIATNNFILSRIKKSKIYSNNHSSKVIFLGIEHERFKSCSKSFARKKLMIKNSKQVILFGCSDFSDLRKGSYIINSVMKEINKSGLKLENILLLTFGEINDFKMENHNIEWKHMGTISSPKTMNLLYRSSDIMINTSIDDLGPTIIQETFLNDVFLISFNMGLAKDLIIDGINGNIINNFNKKKFSNAVVERLKKTKQKINFNHRNIKEMKKKCTEDNESNDFISMIKDLNL
tara:strand:- start:129 stop:1439 length:1311 start_codon:yes stop_codon:yes gene_type:complete